MIGVLYEVLFRVILFEGIYKFAGLIRDYNITKREWVLRGETVYYASADTIRETLEYDMGQERNYSYEGKSIDEAISHLTRFCANLWQIHAFGAQFLLFFCSVLLPIVGCDFAALLL